MSADLFLQFSRTRKYSELETAHTAVEDFVRPFRESDIPICLITSGGTSVPLESKAVRYLDNFSVGTRGSASAEYFLEHGYAVVFLHRLGSLLPFHRLLSSIPALDWFQICDDGRQDIAVNCDLKPKLSIVLRKYKHVKDGGRLLTIPFTTVDDYLSLLHDICACLKPFKSRVMLYLAAAVSDFFIPSSHIPEHKIQSSDGPLNLTLQPVPKLLKPLVHEWVPHAFIVSFKLETDVSLLESKSKQALANYGHQLVIGNCLETRKREVIFVTQEKTVKSIKLSQEDLAKGCEIEELIVTELTHLHSQFGTASVCDTSSN